jgi:UDP-galactopyranose mutase
MDENQAHDAQARMLKRFIESAQIRRYDLWYYTPMGLKLTNNLTPELTIFDCMDELSAFLGAPPQLRELEKKLLQRADVVFTGGMSLYESKCQQHANVHCCPSSIDRDHFAKAQNGLAEAADQKNIPHPRIGFYGVIDERFDTKLLSELAALRPELQFVMVGPVVKIDESLLPTASNIHYLGKRDYADLPAYLAGWDVAILPFARNSATRYISPTKTPEYLAAGCTVVSTSINDVVRPYGEMGLISIADTAVEFARAIDFELHRRGNATWKADVESLLSKTSWDATWSYMSSVIEAAREVSQKCEPVSMFSSTSAMAIPSASTRPV